MYMGVFHDNSVSDLYLNDLVEMYIKQDITEFTEANKVDIFLRQIPSL